MKHDQILLLLLLLLFPATFALTTDQTDITISKGQTLLASGSCTTDVSIQITQNEKQLLTANASCINQHYQFQRKTDYLYPSGKALLNLTENTQQTKTIPVTIRATRESGFLSITVLKPTQQTIERQTTLELSLQLFDAGILKTDASIQTWGWNGNPVSLQPDENGFYTAQIPIPYNAPLGTYELVVTAQNNDSTAGGEQRIPLEIKPARIRITLEKPDQINLPALTRTEFRIHATYADQTPLQNPRALLSFGDQTAPMTAIDPQTFDYRTTFNQQDIGTLLTTIQVTDDANNTGTQTIELSVTNSLPLQLDSYTPYVLGLLVLIVLVWLVILPRIRSHKNQDAIGIQIQKTENDITELQRQYFEKRGVSSEQYRQKSAELEKRLSESKKQIKTKKP
ncbi:MAG: hypothetical protein Q7R47_00980 [Candidatus Diapherotrites archaeon]|nr:hypothetical protein [Candidatus Diapherotrites archaeon]